MNEGSSPTPEPGLGILSVALTRYADACPTSLHPDCPFVREAEGVRACGKECRDEVTRLTRPGHAGISAFSAAFFDARQHLLTESGPVAQEDWHTSSLLTRLEEAILFPPVDVDGAHLLVREIDITNALAYLAHRGYDSDWLVRFGMRRQLALTLTVWVGTCHFHRDDLDGDPTGGWLAIADGLFSGSEPASGLGDWLAGAERVGFRTYVEKWVEQAPLEDLWRWRPAPIEAELVTEDDGQAEWLFDRFSRTYVSEWSTASLYHEHRYLRGSQPAPVSVAEMQKRPVLSTQVALEIANRAVDRPRSHSSQVIRQALRFLNDGRRKEAAGLFDAARIIEPSDADAHNHYGFCLTPDDPEGALAALVRAEEVETSPYPLNRVNQAVALSMLGRLDEALACAERAFAESDLLVGPAWLWRSPANLDACTLAEVDPLEYLVSLGLSAAVALGDEAQVEVWKARAA